MAHRCPECGSDWVIRARNADWGNARCANCHFQFDVSWSVSISQDTIDELKQADAMRPYYGNYHCPECGGLPLVYGKGDNLVCTKCRNESDWRQCCELIVPQEPMYELPREQVYSRIVNY